MTRRSRRARRPGRTRLRDDRGSGTVLTLSVVAAILLVAGLLGLLAGALLAHARAQGAADLAALAAAGRLQRQSLLAAADGSTSGGSVGVDGTPCALAETVADRNGARLGGCEAGPGNTVTLTVAVDGPIGSVTARARAGPRPEATSG